MVIADKTLHKTFKAEMGGDGAVTAVVSTFGIVDSDGDVVRQSAFTDGQEVPMVWSHDWADPVGKGTISVQPDRAIFNGQFFMDTQRGAEAFKTVRAMGGLQEWSWGFRVLDAEVSDAPDGQETNSWYGPGKAQYINRTEVFEVSPVLVGANRQTGTLDIKSADYWLHAIIRDIDTFEKAGRVMSAANQAQMHDAMAKLTALHGSTCDMGEDCPMYEAKSFKAAIAAHSTATSDAAWNGPEAEAALSNDAGAATYKKAFAWVDPEGDPGKKASYKFIHHEVTDGTDVGAANMRACSSAIGVLNGGRGGTTIPEADMAGVHRHLARHMMDGDMEPPPMKETDSVDDRKQLKAERIKLAIADEELTLLDCMA